VQIEGKATRAHGIFKDKAKKVLLFCMERCDRPMDIAQNTGTDTIPIPMYIMIPEEGFIFIWTMMPGRCRFPSRVLSVWDPPLCPLKWILESHTGTIMNTGNNTHRQKRNIKRNIKRKNGINGDCLILFEIWITKRKLL